MTVHAVPPEEAAKGLPEGRGRRIAIVLPSLLPLGGAERVAIDFAGLLLDLGFRVDLICVNEPGDLAAALPAGCRGFNLRARRLATAVWPLARYLREERPDAIQCNMWPLTVVAVVARMLARSPAELVVSDHSQLSMAYGGRGHLSRAILRATLQTYRFADSRVAVSAGVADDLARLSGIARNRFTVIYNPVTTFGQAASKVNEDALWGPREGAGVRILTVGRLKAPKNHALLLDAFHRLDRSDARLAILGTGELEAVTRARVEEFGLNDRIIMPGHVADPSPWYATADLFVLSSDYEGFPLVLGEALSFGLPVVATDCPSGPAEILDNGRYGQLVPVGDAHALATAIENALTNNHDRDALKGRAREFAPEIAARKHLDLLFSSDRRTGVAW